MTNDNNDNNEMDELSDKFEQIGQNAKELQRVSIRLHNGLVEVFKEQTYTVEIEGPDTRTDEDK